MKGLLWVNELEWLVLLVRWLWIAWKHLLVCCWLAGWDFKTRASADNDTRYKCNTTISARLLALSICKCDLGQQGPRGHNMRIAQRNASSIPTLFTWLERTGRKELDAQTIPTMLRILLQLPNPLIDIRKITKPDINSTNPKIRNARALWVWNATLWKR